MTNEQGKNILGKGKENCVSYTDERKYMGMGWSFITFLAASIPLISVAIFAPYVTPIFFIVTGVIAAVAALCFVKLFIDDALFVDKRNQFVEDRVKEKCRATSYQLAAEETKEEKMRTVKYKIEKHGEKYYLVMSKDQFDGYDEKTLNEALGFYTIRVDLYNAYYPKYQLYVSGGFEEVDGNYQKELKWVEEISISGKWKINEEPRKYARHSSTIFEERIHSSIIDPKEIESKGLKGLLNVSTVEIPSPETAKELPPSSLYQWISQKFTTSRQTAPSTCGQQM